MSIEQMFADEKKHLAFTTPEMVKEKLEQRLGLKLKEVENYGWRIEYGVESPTEEVLMVISVCQREREGVKWFDIGGISHTASISEFSHMLIDD